MATPKTKKTLPTYREERLLLGDGCSAVAGLDEVGRGALAGPVVAGAVILPPNPRGKWVRLVRDSKQMTARQRREAFCYLRDKAVSVETGLASSSEIDELGIVGATRLAMKRALAALRVRPEFLLLDAFPLPGVSIRQKAIIHGDALCLSIAAASIAAKVTRDGIMEQQHSVYPEYGFERHKGYATRRHLDRLKARGPCVIHRYSFAPVRQWRRLL